MKRFIALTMLLFCIFLFGLQIAQANEIFHTVLEQVVMIISMDENYQPIGIGSGFVIGKDGEIATNYHVVEGASSALVKFVNKEEKYSVDNIVQTSTKYDLAIIQISTKSTPLLLGDDELVSVGNRIYAIGNPEGLEGTVSEGIISGFRKGINRDRHLFLLISLLQDDRRRLKQFNNLVFFKGKHKEAEEFLIQIVKALGIIIDRRPKKRPRKRKS